MEEYGTVKSVKVKQVHTGWKKNRQWLVFRMS